MGGWSGGVYTRFRNWATDKANSINPQAANFDQEDDGFAAGLNNCITKDGLNKPTAPMDWNGQNLIGVLALTAGNLNVTGATVPANGCYLSAANTLSFATASTLRGSINATGAWNIAAATSGVTMTVNGAPGTIFLWSDSSSRQGSLFTGSAGVQIGSLSNHAFGFFVNNGALGAQLTTGNLFQAVDQGGTMQDLGWRDMPPNVQTANYTLALSDRGKMIRQNTAATTITIPANASIPFPDGSAIVIVNNTAGNISVAITTDTLFLAGTVTTGTRTIGPNGIGTVVKAYASTQWSISGPGVS